jgi:hypothetical protein
MLRVVKRLADGFRRQKEQWSRTSGAALAGATGGVRITTVTARLSGLFLFAALSFSFACGDRDEPRSGGSPVGPELAGSFSCTDFSSLPRYPDEPRPTVAEEICAARTSGTMSPNDVNSALSKLVKAIRDTTGDGEALLASFIKLKWRGLPATADDLEHLLDHLVLAEAGLVESGAVADKDGDVECLPNGKSCAAFDPNWSTVDRIWVGTEIDCSTLEAATTLDVFGPCQHLDTQLVTGGSGGVFAVPVTLVLCTDAPSTVTSTPAKVFEASKDDPLGTNFEEIEYFNSSPVADPPSCSSALTSRTAAPVSGGAGVLAGQKGGAPNGLALQGIGTKVSLFSDWGLVDLESAIIQGTISSSGGGTVSGASVELLCGSGPTDLATSSDGAGVYSFDNGPTHIFQPGESCRVKASKSGFGTSFSAFFTVQKGLNDEVNVTL